jgi:predicted  nucleic acid-binding Zn ribbon protein
MSDDKTYQHDKKCPKCAKRKVYLQVIQDIYYFICQACGFRWKA